MLLLVPLRDHVGEHVLQDLPRLDHHAVSRRAPRHRLAIEGGGNETIDPERGFPESPAAHHHIEPRGLADDRRLRGMRPRQMDPADFDGSFEAVWRSRSSRPLPFHGRPGRRRRTAAVTWG